MPQAGRRRNPPVDRRCPGAKIASMTGKAPAKERRKKKLATALRANLKRRKEAAKAAPISQTAKRDRGPGPAEG